MPYETILYAVDGAVATLTLNRPDKYNAFNNTMTAEVLDVLKTTARDEAVRALVFTGAGKGFCTGQDLAEMAARGDISIGDHLRKGYNEIVRRMRTLEKPIIGAINGVAAGAGSSMALACDVRIMAESASLVLASFVNIGLIPDSGATFMLPRLVGMSRAFELMMLADGKNRVSAARALELGLCATVVPGEQLEAETRALAGKLAGMPTRAIGLTKRALNRSWANTLDDSLELEAQLQDFAGHTEDFREGIAAFNEKRDPVFKGR